MLELGLTDLVTFFVAIAIFLIFAAVWIIKSESARNVLKNEIRRLKGQIESYERDKFLLLEKMNTSEGLSVAREAPGEESDMRLTQALEENKALEKDNKKLKAELVEAKSSLEEIYKAFVEKKTKTKIK